MRVHNEKNHGPPNKFKCETCEERFTTQSQRSDHMIQCIERFQTVNIPICRYFENGYCTKGDSCSFLHQPKNTAPFCMNGPGCGYLANSVCSFFHPGVGVQRPRYHNHSAFGPNNNHQNIQREKVSSLHQNNTWRIVPESQIVPIAFMNRIFLH